MSGAAPAARRPDLGTPATAGREGFAAYLGDDTTKALVARFAAARGWPASAAQPGGLAAAVRTLAVGEPPAVLLVDVSGSADPAGDFDMLREAIDAGCRVIVAGSSNDARLYRSLLARGAVDYLVKPFDETALGEAVDRAEGDRRQTAPRKARRIAVVGARGGVGASTVACALAGLFASDHRLRTTLIDLDLRFGDAALALGVACGAGLRECLESPDRIDDLFLERAVVGAGDRLRVLGAEEPIGEEPRPDGGALAELATHLARTSDMIVVDLPRGYRDLARALSAVDELIVVVELTLASLRDAHRLKELVRGVEGGPQVRVVANRAGKSGTEQITRSEFETALGQRLALCLPVDREAVAAAAALGRPLCEAARRSRLAAALAALAREVAGTTQPAGLLGRLLAGLRR